jgi:DNA-binding GntR family transcriptional regulator
VEAAQERGDPAAVSGSLARPPHCRFAFSAARQSAGFVFARRTGYSNDVLRGIRAQSRIQPIMTATAETVLLRGRESARDVAYAHVKQKILDNIYAPGAQVLEKTISAELGLSRTPVREALVRLEQEGLLRIVPRHGIEVLSLSPDDMREIYEILASLEPKAVELLTARRPSRDDVKALEMACDAMEAGLDRHDLEGWATADEAFHLALVDLCGNRRLAAAVMSFWEQTHRVRMFTLRLRPMPVDSTREHRAVLDAVLAGDAARARQLYEAHRVRAQAVLLNLLRDFNLNRF